MHRRRRLGALPQVGGAGATPSHCWCAAGGGMKEAVLLLSVLIDTTTDGHLLTIDHVRIN